MPKFIKRSATVTAVVYKPGLKMETAFLITGSEGGQTVSEGDYLIQDRGRYVFMSKEDFEEEYERVR